MPIEDCRVSFHQLTQIVEDWDIPSRITQKIQIWDLRYSQTNIDKIPISFLFYSFIYFILKKHPEFIQDYTQDKLMAISLTLKKTYTIQCHQYFKKTSNFDFAFICLAKSLQYFLVVHFPKGFLSKNQESSIYSIIVEAVLGYSVSQSTYSMVERRLKKNKPKNVRDSIDFEQIGDVSLTQKTLKSEKKIQRKGEFNLFEDLESEKKLIDVFKMEIHEALYVKRSLPSKKDINRPKIHHNIQQNKNSQKSISQWRKNIFSVMNLHQISSSMAMQPGFDGIRGSSGVHISKKRDLRQTCIPSEYKKKTNIFSTPSQILSSVKKPKSWSKIINKMKQVGKENKKINIESGSPIVTPSNFQLKAKVTKFSKKKSKALLQLKPLQFRSLNPSPRISMETFPCDQEFLPAESKKVSFAQELTKFEKKCNQRRLNIEDFSRNGWQ